MSPAPPTLLLTRPEPEARQFLRDLTAQVGPVPAVISPVLRIEPTGAVPSLDGVAAVVLTSARAVPAVAGAGLSAFCVGDRTAAAARAAGLRAVSAQGDADALVTLVRDRAPKGRLLFPHGAETRGAVADRLRAEGFEVIEAVVYRQVAQPLTAEARRLLDGHAPVLVPVFSPRSAGLLSRACGEAAAPLVLIAISAAAAEAWDRPVPQDRRIAQTPDALAVLDEIRSFYPHASA